MTFLTPTRESSPKLVPKRTPMASYGSGNYGGGDYGESNTYGSAGGYTPSSSTVEGTAVPVASSVTAEGNTYQSSPSLAQHPSTMPDSKMKV